MISDNIYHKVSKNIDRILRFDHIGTHCDLLSELCPDEDVEVVYAHVLYYLGTEVLMPRLLCNMDLNDNEYWANDLFVGSQGAGDHVTNDVPKVRFNHFGKLVGIHYYIATSLRCIPATHPITKAMSSFILDKAPLTENLVAVLPVSLSFSMLCLELCNPKPQHRFFFTEDYVRGLTKASEDYQYPDIEALYHISHAIINRAHVTMGMVYEKVFSKRVMAYSQTLHTESYSRDELLKSTEACKIIAESYFNSTEHHECLNQLFGNVFNVVMYNKNMDLLRKMKRHVDSKAFYPIDKELDAKTKGYLKLLQ